MRRTEPRHGIQKPYACMPAFSNHKSRYGGPGVRRPSGRHVKCKCLKHLSMLLFSRVLRHRRSGRVVGAAVPTEKDERTKKERQEEEAEGDGCKRAARVQSVDRIPQR